MQTSRRNVALRLLLLDASWQLWRCRWWASQAAGPAGDRAPPVFETSYAEGFEGWGIVARRHAPMYDVKYRGYGADKISWTHHLHRAAFRCCP